MRIVRRLSTTALSACLLVPMLASGCANRQYATPEEAIANSCSALGTKALSGALIGGVAGAAGGAAIGAAAGNGKGAAIGAGVGLLVGIAAGLAAGHHTDQQDCQQAQIALQQMSNQPVNQLVAWANPATGSHGSYTPVGLEYTSNDHVCRQFKADYTMEKNAPVYGDTGVVCRTAAGDWARVAVKT
jgi:surface antigen